MDSQVCAAPEADYEARTVRQPPILQGTNRERDDGGIQLIDIIQDIYEQVSAVEGFEGRVYRKWPKTKAKLPSCLISRISAIPVFTDAEGHEICTQLAYSIDINASDADKADALAEEIGNRLARYNLHRSGDTEFYDDTFRAYRRVLTFYGTVDVRGNTFT